MRRTARARLAVVCLLALPTLAHAAQGTVSVHLGAEVRPRVVVEADRRVAALGPGERVTIHVTVKARVAPEAAILLTVEPSLPPEALAANGRSRVTYEAAGVTGRLGRSAVVARLRGSGIHRLAVTFTLSPRSAAAVTVPVRFAAAAI